ncbi:metal-dependent hydrolase [Enterobacteriaceae endosymbiont of Plateumaris consimilis]|uniref:metal-dependent hydrolase n=1 Tax=Enterobacteriaceae endosymbiont of Plateumaris consimilis TaxID=2675794 RepID=UPI001448B63D|nr:metal-dependent hydrolase [Enterobacteriaceae endosymbiont of Plateumaris consimilis]QJC28446.1 metal-dependent hydrolase [Enterobacteriaceae endosymbiont of Plateumaris consimilis]
MKFKGHIIFAISSSILIQHFILNKYIIQYDWWHIIPASIITCLLPDIDHPKSFLGNKIKIFSYIISKIFGHRGFTHSLLSLIIIIIFLNYYSFNIIPIDIKIGFIIGYSSHICSDMLTPYGVPLLWPYKKKFSLPIIKNNFFKEEIFCYVLLILSLYLLFPIGNNFIIRLYNNVSH